MFKRQSPIMGTYDQMMVDNHYLYSQQPTTQQDIPNNDQNGNGLYGQSAYGSKPDGEMYRYVSSRLTGRSSPPIRKTASGHTGVTTTDPYGIESDNIGANNPHSQMPYGQESKSVSSQRHSSNTLTNMPKTDARQDSLLGPLFAELDAMTNQPQSQQQPPSHAPSIHSRSSISYQSNFVAPSASSQPNHRSANRTVTNSVHDGELYDPLDPNNQQQLAYPLNMNGDNMYMPSSTTDPGSYYNQYDSDNQGFEKPAFITSGQNYSSNPRPPPQHHTTFDQTHARSPPPPPPFKQQNTNPFIDHLSQHSQGHNSYKMNPANNQEMFLSDHNDNNFQPRQQGSMPTQRGKYQQGQYDNKPAVPRTNIKVQEKNLPKRDPPGRGKATTGSSITSNSNTGQPSSRRPMYQPPASKLNHIDKNIDMIRNKENQYHRYPPRKYEDSYSRRKDFQGGNEKYDQGSEAETSNTRPRLSSLPLTINLKTTDNSLNKTLPATVTIPLDTHTNHPGETISVDINLRLVDTENSKQQQQQPQASEHPNWTSADALERHIRKLERSIDQALPTTNLPQRHPIMPSTSAHPSASRYAKSTAGTSYSGYNPPNHAKDHYNYSDKGREENSYLAKMNYSKTHTEFKPYTSRDYERFRKNCGFGTGHLGFDADSSSYKEKTEKVAKVKEYAQQIEARNKKILSDINNHTFSGRRSPTEETKTMRLFEQTQLPRRTAHFSKKSPRSSPVSMTEIVPFVPARRPTDALYRPPNGHRPTEVVHQLPQARRPPEVDSQSPPARRRPAEFGSQSPPARRRPEVGSQSPPVLKRRTKFPTYENHEIPERFNRHPEQDEIPVRRIVNPPVKRREPTDENNNRHVSRIESPPQNRMNLRRLSPTKLSSPPGRINSDTVSKRRPLRFDKLLLPEEPTDSSPERPRPIPPPPPPQQQHKRKSTGDLLENPQNDDDSLMKIVHDELSERPLDNNEELVVVE